MWVCFYLTQRCDRGLNPAWYQSLQRSSQPSLLPFVHFYYLVLLYLLPTHPCAHTHRASFSLFRQTSHLQPTSSVSAIVINFFALIPTQPQSTSAPVTKHPCTTSSAYAELTPPHAPDDGSKWKKQNTASLTCTVSWHQYTLAEFYEDETSTRQHSLLSTSCKL